MHWLYVGILICLNHIIISPFSTAAPKVSSITEDGCLVEWTPLKHIQGQGDLHYRVSLTKLKDNEAKIVSLIKVALLPQPYYLKFAYSEKATKILRNFHLFLSVCTVDKKGGDFAKLLWLSQNIRTLPATIIQVSSHSQKV